MSGLVEILQATIHVVNLPATLLLLLVLVYWLTVIAGVLDLSTLDIEFPEVEAEVGGEAPDHPAFEGLLEYFNIRHVPISIVLSFFALSFWIVSMLGNHYLNGFSSLAIGFGIFAANIVISSHVAKFTTMPMAPLFRSMQTAASSKRELVGSRVVVVSSTVDDKFGCAEISEDDGAPITLNVRAEGETLAKGDEAVILRHEAAKDVYIICKLEV